MFKATICPQLGLSIEGRPLPPRLLALLVGIDETGSLSAACRQLGLSYRYAWGLLREAEQHLGEALMDKARGRGTRLTGLAQTLVWAERRVQARLSPTLDMLASEIEVEVGRHRRRSDHILRIHASHGFAVETLSRILGESETALALKYASSEDVLSALRGGQCDLAGLHLPLGPLQPVMLAHYAPWLDRSRDQVLHLARRRLGLIVAAGNPQRIAGLHDLARVGVRFINRQPGSGTRLLLKLMLQAEGIAAPQIEGFDSSEFTHAAVAAHVASGMADAGFGLEAPARRFQLDFIPLLQENYFFLFERERLSSERLDALQGILRHSRFRDAIGHLAGYDITGAGLIQSLDQAFPA